MDTKCCDLRPRQDRYFWLFVGGKPKPRPSKIFIDREAICTNRL